MDTSTTFCGVRFPNPFILPSAQAVRTRTMIRRAFQAGWGGAVTQTISVDASSIRNVMPRLHAVKTQGVAFGIVNIDLITTRRLADWLEDIRAIRDEFPERPLIASIMGEGYRPDEWKLLAEMCTRAGASALELNVSCPHGMPERGTGAFIGQSAELTYAATSWVVTSTHLPVIVKLTPNVTDIVPIALAAMQAGAQGITAINNLKSLAGVDIETLRPLPDVDGYSAFGGYAGPGLKPVGLRCVAEIAQAVPDAAIAGCGGIETWEDAVEYFLLGAQLAQVYTPVMTHGLMLINALVEGLTAYLERKQFANFESLVGQALPKIIAHELLPRHSDLKATYQRDLCTQCGQCVLSCEDAGFQAIHRGTDGFPVIDPAACDGCNLCVILCPVPSCMSLSEGLH